MIYLKPIILSSLLSCFFLTQMFSQESEKKGLFILQGNVIEKETELGIPYVTVRVFDSKRNCVTAISSNDKGSYSILVKKHGLYLLKYYAMGYSEDSLYVNVIEGGVTKIGNIGLSAGEVLQGVKIVAQKSLITQEVDKLVYDVSLDPDARKMKMSEIMKKIPHMQQRIEDGKFKYLDENISTIQINGGKNDLISGSRQYPMNFIRGDVMSKIEIIMPNTSENKTDKYIINIKLAREIPNGFASQIQLNANTSNRYRGSSDFASKIGNVYYSFNYGLSYENAPKLRTYTEKENMSQTQNYIQRDTSYSWSDNLAHNYIFGLGAEISKKHKFYITLSAQKSDKEIDNQIFSRKYDSNQQQINYTINRSSLKYNNYPGLNAEISYSGLGMVIDYGIYNTFTKNIRNLNNNLTEETLSSKENTISGSSSKKINNKVRLLYFASYTNRFYSNISDLSGLDYKSNILNASVNIQYVEKQYAATINLNLNNENIKGEFNNNGIDSELDYNKLKILPQLAFSYLSGRKYRFNFLYDISITRPGLSTLNPFIDKSDPENLLQGNPNLKPEILHNISLKLRKQMAGLYLNSELSYKYTKGAIERLAELYEDGKSYTTYGNVGVRHNFGLELGVRYKIKSLTISENITVNRNVYLDAEKKLNNSLFSISNRASLDGTLTKTTSFTLNFDIRPQAKSAQSKTVKYYSILSLQLSQILVKNKLYCGVTINDPFNSRRFLYSNIGNDEFRITTNRETIGRIFSFFIRWNFGRFNEKPEGLGTIRSAPSDVYVP
ncbi:MAG: outer membrane beta-barrel protein [Bacteroidales bacterium]